MHRRMVPHIFGWFTMSSAWFIIIAHLEWAKADLSLITDRTIPGWVDAAIYGTVIIVSNPFNTTCAFVAPTHTHTPRADWQFVSFGFVRPTVTQTHLNPLKHISLGVLVVPVCAHTRVRRIQTVFVAC